MSADPFDIDIFISHHMPGDAALGDETAWVREFHVDLEAVLTERLGQRPNIWRDITAPRTLQPDTIKALNKSKLFLPILSPAFYESQLGLEELLEFTRAAERTGGLQINNYSRIFKIERMPIARSREREVLADLLGYRFYEESKDGSELLLFGRKAEEGREQYYRVLSDLASDIERTLKSLDELTRRRTTAGSEELSDGGSKEVFLAYSYQDQALAEELITYLKILRRRGLITGWHARVVELREVARREVDPRVNTASLILPLFSPDFLASNYAVDVDMQRAMQRHAAREALVIPIILRSSGLSYSLFERLQVLPKDARPVVSWELRDEAFLNIIEGIESALSQSQVDPTAPDVIGTFSAPDSVKIFIAYSRKDDELRMELEPHLLSYYRRDGLIRGWRDREISDWVEGQSEIDPAVETADLILLLVSADFIASDYCYDAEVVRAMERHNRGEAVVIPIILRPTTWSHTPFGKLQALPRDGTPVMRWADRDHAFASITEGILRAAERLTAYRPSTRETGSPQSDQPPPAPRRMKLFLSHASADAAIVRSLYEYLRVAGTEPWMDIMSLTPGNIWEKETVDSIRASDVALVCLSRNSVNRRGYIQREIEYILEAAAERPERQVFLIPVRLEECKVPNKLSQWHWVDLFREGGYQLLLRTLRSVARERGLLIPELLSGTEIPVEESRPRRQRVNALLEPGDFLQHRYEVIERISSGELGAVYYAKDRELGNLPRAIKELIPAHLDDSQREKAVADFHRESRLLASLEHPSLPRIYDYFYDDAASRFYLVMQYISGGTLLERLSASPSGRINEETVTEWSLQLVDALDYLHGREIVFRDLTPANVMLDEQRGRVMLINFGIAHNIAPQQEEGITTIRTTAYSPPELFSGRVEPRSDIYSLGAMMFHLLTGSEPRENSVRGPDFSKPSPRQLNPNISSDMARIIMRAIERDPERRFGSAAEMRDALAEHLEKMRSGAFAWLARLPLSLRNVVASAEGLRLELNDEQLSTEHLLWGLCQMRTGLTRSLLRLTHNDQQIEQGLQELIGVVAPITRRQLKPISDSQLSGVPLSANCLEALNRARDISNRLLVAEKDLLAGLLDVPGSRAAGWLSDRLGLPAETLFDIIISERTNNKILERLLVPSHRPQPSKEAPAAAVQYRVGLTRPAEAVPVGGDFDAVLYLSPIESDGEVGLFEVPRDEVVGAELNVFLDAPGFHINGAPEASLPLDAGSPDGDGAPTQQKARFRLSALLPGPTRIAADLYLDSVYKGKVEAEVEVAGIDEVRLLEQGGGARARAAEQPDLTLRIRTVWEEDGSGHSFHFQMSSPRPAAGYVQGGGRSRTFPAGEVARIQSMLEATLQDAAGAAPEDARLRLMSFGRFLFENVLPEEARTILREPADDLRTMLVLADQDAWLPWELLHNGRFFLTERFAIGRWLSEMGDTLSYEFPLGTVEVGYYDGVSEQAARTWAELLRPPYREEAELTPRVLPGGGLSDLQLATSLRGLHLIRDADFRGPAERARLPVKYEGEGVGADIARAVQPIKLNLRRNRPLVSLSYLSAGVPEVTAIEQTWMATFVRAGCSAFVGPLWAVRSEIESAFLSSFYSRLWFGESLASAFQTARWQARVTVPDSLDWLAYVLVGDPLARPYRPVQGAGYAVVEPVGREIDDPVPPGREARFRVSLRRRPPIWHGGRVIDVTETLSFEQLRVHVMTFGLQVTPASPVTLTLTPGGDYLGWFKLVAPAEGAEASYVVQVYFVDGSVPVHSLMFTHQIGSAGGSQ